MQSCRRISRDVAGIRFRRRRSWRLLQPGRSPAFAAVLNAFCRAAFLQKSRLEDTGKGVACPSRSRSPLNVSASFLLDPEFGGELGKFPGMASHTPSETFAAEIALSKHFRRFAPVSGFLNFSSWLLFIRQNWVEPFISADAWPEIPPN